MSKPQVHVRTFGNSVRWTVTLDGKSVDVVTHKFCTAKTAIKLAQSWLKEHNNIKLNSVVAGEGHVNSR